MTEPQDQTKRAKKAGGAAKPPKKEEKKKVAAATTTSKRENQAMTEQTLQERKVAAVDAGQKPVMPAEQVQPPEAPAEVSVGETVAEAGEAVMEKAGSVADEIVEKVEEAAGAGEPAAAAPSGEPAPHVATPMEQVGTQINDLAGQIADGFVSAGKGLQRQFDQPAKQFGDFAGKTLEQVRDYVKNDLSKLGEQLDERFPAEKLQASALSLLSKGASSLGNLLQGWSRKIEDVSSKDKQ